MSGWAVPLVGASAMAQTPQTPPPAFDSLTSARAASIPAAVTAITVRGYQSAGDSGLPMRLARLAAPPAASSPWDYSIGGGVWQLQNHTVTPQMVGYLSGATAIQAIANAAAYCNFHGGCTIDLPPGDYLINVAAGKAAILKQSADWIINFEHGARIVSGPQQSDANLKIWDGPRGLAQTHRLVIRNPVMDISAGVTPDPGITGNTALEIQGQKQVEIVNPDLSGGARINPNANVGIAITGVVYGRIIGGKFQGFNNTAIYPEGYNVAQKMPENSSITIR